jgi:hypothetical protein
MTATAQQRAGYLARLYAIYPALAPDRGTVTIGQRPYRIRHDHLAGTLISRLGWLHATAGGAIGAILHNHTTGLIHVTGVAALDTLPHRTVHDALAGALTPDRRTA